MTSFLDTLEASAKAVLHRGERPSRDGGGAYAASLRDLAEICSPDNILALVRVARAAMAQRTADEEGYCTTYDLDDALDALPQ